MSTPFILRIFQTELLNSPGSEFILLVKFQVENRGAQVKQYFFIQHKPFQEQTGQM